MGVMSLSYISGSGHRLGGHYGPMPQRLVQPLHPGPLVHAVDAAPCLSLAQEESGDASLRSALALAAMFRFAGEHPSPLRSPKLQQIGP
jgi:hypothetical protein